jgi:hypothetical protein
MSHFIYCYAESRYAECHYAECRYAECRYAECHYTECQYAECHYAECRYAECHYADWRGAMFLTKMGINYTKKKFYKISLNRKSNSLLDKLISHLPWSSMPMKFTQWGWGWEFQDQR